MDDMALKQLQLEREADSVQAGVARYRRLAEQARNRGEAAALKPAERLLLHWMPDMVKAIKADQMSTRLGEVETGRVFYGPVFLAIDAERMAVITLNHMLGLCIAEPGGVKFVHAAYTIGNSVVAECIMDLIKIKAPTDTDMKRGLDLLTKKIRRVTPAKIVHWSNKHMKDKLWNRKICVHVGARLIWHCIGLCSSNPSGEEFRLAFHHQRRLNIRKRRQAFIVMDDSLHRLVADGHSFREILRPICDLMVYPPRPGKGNRAGGYLTHKNDLVIRATAGQKDMLRRADLSLVHDAVNFMSATPWRCNEFIRDVAKEIVFRGGNLAGIPPYNDIEFPPKPHDIDTNAEAKKAWKAKASVVRSKNIKLRSTRAEVYTRLDAIERVSGMTFYMPHELDFRGRGYPRPSTLSHHQDDLSRALLLFDSPDREQDMFWVGIQAANSAGFDKASNRERFEWARAWAYDLAQVCDYKDAVNCASETWAASDIDNPFQFLAAIMAMTSETSGPLIPIQRDGTANGLQHYAAITLDETLAQMVNLTPSDRPSDGYTMLGATVESIIVSDSNAGKPAAMLFLAKLNGLDSARRAKAMRKIAKRPMMTKTYQVTNVGARNQIADELKDMGFEAGSKELFDVSKYLAEVVLRSLATMAPSAHRAMDWLAECARICVDTGIPLRWNTDDGFCVEQPYRSLSKATVRTCVQNVTLVASNDDLPISKKKQVSAFPANFIHSLDATHERAVARKCREVGIPFAQVHDSFWTTPVCVETLDKIIREEFVKLHQENVLERLRQQLQHSYQLDLPACPTRGKFDLGQTLQSEYFFN